MFSTEQKSKNNGGLDLRTDTWKISQFSKVDGQYGKQLEIKLEKAINETKTIAKLQWIPIPDEKADFTPDILKEYNKFVNYTSNYVNAFNGSIVVETFSEYLTNLFTFAETFIGKEVEILLIPPLKWNQQLKKWVLKVKEGKELFTEIPKNSSTQQNFIKGTNESIVIEVPKNLNELYKEMLQHNQNLKDGIADNLGEDENITTDW